MNYFEWMQIATPGLFLIGFYLLVFFLYRKIKKHEQETKQC